MTPDLHCFHLARFVLEAETAFAVNSGLRDGAFDSLIVKDANGLPAIPGTSLAGVLRRHYTALAETADNIDLASANQVFGYAEKDTGEASRLHISWGYCHDSQNKALEGIGFAIETDPILERLQQAHSFHRERVSINERGTAKDGSKFDLTVAPAGCRFSFEISYWAQQKSDKEWQQILGLLQRPLQLGSNTRNGLGWFKLHSLFQISLDLKDKADWKTYKQLPVAIGDTQLLSAFADNSDLEEPIQASITLEAEDFWRFGQQGEGLLPSTKPADGTPLLEPVVDWTTNPASFSVKKVVIPASGVKGALAHRVQFHYAGLQGQFIDQATETDTDNQSGAEPNIIFGMASDEQDKLGQAGLLLFKDLYLQEKPTAAHLCHNSIDRFTGGVRDKVLFTEELIWQNGFTLEIKVDLILLKQLETNVNMESLQHYKAALKQALDDLIKGRLALGAGSAKGHGYFTGSISWSDNGQWIGESND